MLLELIASCFFCAVTLLHFGEDSRMALETVRNHKTRSFLTGCGDWRRGHDLRGLHPGGPQQRHSGLPRGLQYQHTVYLRLGLRHPCRAHERRRTQPQRLHQLSGQRKSFEAELAKTYKDAVMKRTWLKLGENASQKSGPHCRHI